MKKITFIIFLTVLTSSAFSQQFLWSTTKDTALKSMRYVPVNNVVNEVLEFYEHYQYYYDGSGFSKDGFVKTFENRQSFKSSNNSRWKELKKKIYEINELTVFAFKDNLGHGSVILVVCVTKDNVDILSFSNTYDEDAIIILPSDKEKFTKWFRTIISDQSDQSAVKSNVEKNVMQNQEADEIVDKVENEAECPGGNAAWARYVRKAQDGFDAGKNGAAPGKYQVVVRFIVAKDGTVSDVQAETNFGYGMEEIAIKVIKEGPNWKPALKNGRNVIAYRRQPITFTVEAKN